GIDGEVRFTVFQSSAGAGAAIQSGAAQTVLAGRPALRPALHDGRIRNFHWPLPGPAPRAWVAVVARPDVSAAALRQLREWGAGPAAAPAWARIPAPRARRPPPPRPKGAGGPDPPHRPRRPPRGDRPAGGEPLNTRKRRVFSICLHG